MAPTEPETPLEAPLLDEAENAEPPMPKGFWKRELRAIFALAAPCIVTTCSSQTMVVTDQVFVGHLGVSELAAAALGNTYFNLLWFFLLGCSTALDTLGSQAFGANDYSSLLTWTYASLVVLSGLCGVMAVGLWYGREVAVHLFFQEPAVAELVGQFCRWLIPGLWPMMWSVVAMKFMQTQNVMLPPAIVAAGTCAFNVASNALFIHYLGFKGAPMATSFSRFVQFFVYVGVVVVLQHRHHPGGWGRWLVRSRRCWGKALSPRILGAFLSLGIPGGCMLALEAGSFDITTAFAGALGQVEVSAHSTLLGVCTYTFISFPFAVATAATIRVGNLLGAGRAKQAALAGMLCVVSGTLFQGTCGLIMFAARHSLGYLFTNDPEVAGLVARIAIFGVAFQFFDGAFGTSQGVLRGMGRQHQLMAFNLIGFWGSGVAFGWWLTFRTSLGLKGLWIGIDTGDFVAAALCVLTWLLVNWKKEVRKALDRMAVSHDHEAELGHVEGEPDDWHDFLVPVKHHAGGGPLAAGNSDDTGTSNGHGHGTAAGDGSAATHPHHPSSAAVAIGGGGGGDPAKDPANDPYSEALLAQGAGRNPYGSPRFGASPRFRGA